MSLVIVGIISIISFGTLILSIFLFPQIRIGKHHLKTYWIIPFVTALILIIGRFINLNTIKEVFFSNDSINPLKILILFFSMTFISIFLDEVGFFKYLTIKIVNKVKNNQFILFTSLYFLTAILTIFTSNDIVILTLTPFICLFYKATKVNPIPYLLAEFAAANTWSMMLIIGNPTNIYLASSANILFLDYLKVMLLPTIIGGITEFLILLLIFNRSLKKRIEIEEIKEADYQMPLIIIGLVHLIICLISLSISNYLHLPMWLIALITSISLIISYLLYSAFKKDSKPTLIFTFKRLPYPLIIFIISMTIIILTLNYQGITKLISQLLDNNQPIFTFGIASYLSSNLINNIPMSILFSSISKNIESFSFLKAIYATTIGSNIGAFLSPIGALAGIMFTTLLDQYDVSFKFKDFMKYGLLISLPTIMISLIILNIEFL